MSIPMNVRKRLNRTLRKQGHQSVKLYTDQFMFHKDEKRFSQEVSSLPDVGTGDIELVNPKTGNSVMFEFTKYHKICENTPDEEIGGWEYASKSFTPKLTLTIWND